jgi:hypothetical protein
VTGRPPSGVHGVKTGDADEENVAHAELVVSMSVVVIAVVVVVAAARCPGEARRDGGAVVGRGILIGAACGERAKSK